MRVGWLGVAGMGFDSDDDHYFILCSTSFFKFIFMAMYLLV